MIVHVKLFAAHRQLLGRRELDLEVPDDTTVLGAWQHLKATQPPLGHLSDTLVAAVNRDYMPLDTRLHAGDEVAFIPPVSGGANV